MIHLFKIGLGELYRFVFLAHVHKTICNMNVNRDHDNHHHHHHHHDHHDHHHQDHHHHHHHHQDQNRYENYRFIVSNIIIVAIIVALYRSKTTNVHPCSRQTDKPNNNKTIIAIHFLNLFRKCNGISKETF